MLTPTDQENSLCNDKVYTPIPAMENAFKASIYAHPALALPIKIKPLK
jgi:hypothetical protein